MSGKSIFASRKRSLRNLRPNSSARKLSLLGRQLSRGERVLTDAEIAELQAVVTRAMSRENSPANEMRNAIESGWLSRPENSARAFESGVVAGRKAMRCEILEQIKEMS